MEAHSQGRLSLFWSKQDDGQDQTTALNQRSYALENPPMWITGRGPREEEDSSALIKAVPCMTCSMVSLQGLYLGDAFRHPNVSTSVGLKSFCPWCLKLGRNTETIAICLWQVHYMMVIMCDICWVFACMSAQSILDHHLGCKTKHDKECAEHEGPITAPKKRGLWNKRKHPSHMVQMLLSSHMEQNVALHLPSSQAGEHKLVHSLDHC